MVEPRPFLRQGDSRKVRRSYESINEKAEADNVPSFQPERIIRPEWVARFRQDAETHLHAISQGLSLLPLELGQTSTQEEAEKEQQALRELYRHAHSMKGSARMVGLMEIGEQAQLLEEQLNQAYFEPGGFDETERAAVKVQIEALLLLVKG